MFLLDAVGGIIIHDGSVWQGIYEKKLL